MKATLYGLCSILVCASFAWSWQAQSEERRDPTRANLGQHTAPAAAAVPTQVLSPRLELVGLVVAKGAGGSALLRVGEDLVRVQAGAVLRSPNGWTAQVERVDAQGVQVMEASGTSLLVR